MNFLFIGDTIKKKWRGLRDNFRKEFLKQGKPRSGDSGGPKQTSKWAYFESMLFLKDIISNRGSSGNIPSVEGCSSDDRCLNNEQYNEDEEIEENESLEKATKSQGDSVVSETLRQPFSKKSKRQDCMESMVQLEKEKIDILKRASRCNDDPDYHFLMSLLPDLKKIKQDNKLKVRIKLQQVLLEEQERQQYEPSSCQSNPSSRTSSVSNDNTYYRNSMSENAPHPYMPTENRNIFSHSQTVAEVRENDSDTSRDEDLNVATYFHVFQ